MIETECARGALLQGEVRVDTQSTATQLYISGYILQLCPKNESLMSTTAEQPLRNTWAAISNALF